MLVASLLCTALTAEHGWTLTLTSVQPAASPKLKWLNRETDDELAYSASNLRARLHFRYEGRVDPKVPRCRYAQPCLGCSLERC